MRLLKPILVSTPIFILISILILFISYDNDVPVDGDLNAGFPFVYLHQDGGFQCATKDCNPQFRLGLLILNLTLYYIVSFLISFVYFKKMSK